MEGEQETTASVEPETPAIEQDVERPVSLDDPETPEVETEPQAEDDSEEFDWNGQKVRGPKGLKDGVLMQADYTRKTQEIATTRRELEERAARLNQQFEASEEYLDARADLRAVSKEIERFKGFGWAEYQQLRQSDPMTADETWNYVQHLQTQRNNLTATVQQHEQWRGAEAQQDIAKRLHETQEFARTKIPGWTQETDKQVIDFALAEGVPAQDLAGAMSPTVYKILHLARIGAQALQKPATTPKPNTPPPAPLKVVAAKANPPARKSFGEMSMDEYVAARQAGRGG